MSHVPNRRKEKSENEVVKLHGKGVGYEQNILYKEGRKKELTTTYTLTETEEAGNKKMEIWVSGQNKIK